MTLETTLAFRFGVTEARYNGQDTKHFHIRRRLIADVVSNQGAAVLQKRCTRVDGSTVTLDRIFRSMPAGIREESSIQLSFDCSGQEASAAAISQAATPASPAVSSTSAANPVTALEPGQGTWTFDGETRSLVFEPCTDRSRDDENLRVEGRATDQDGLVFYFTLAKDVASIRVMLDLDAGMHRTGIGFGPNATKLYREIDAHPYLEPSGFHLYDGHENYSDVVQREAEAQKHIKSLQEFQQQIESAGMPVPCVVAGGSWSFPYYARTQGMFGSPGTFIYWDAGYRRDMPDMPFRWAALILTQVVDRYPDAGTITTDLGCKGISSDLLLEERAYLLGHETAELVSQSEEHGVFRISGELPFVGDYLLAVPGHISVPTTIRYPGIHVIDSTGKVVDYYLHTARDRRVERTRVYSRHSPTKTNAATM